MTVNLVTIDKAELDALEKEVERLKHIISEANQMLNAVNLENASFKRAITDRDRVIGLKQDEIERLRKSVEDWHDAAVRAERNAAMSQEETLAHIDRLAALMDENERLRADHTYACDVADNLRAEIKTLRNQAVLNLEDAERWRKLERLFDDCRVYVTPATSDSLQSVDALRNYIDAAREGE